MRRVQRAHFVVVAVVAVFFFVVLFCFGLFFLARVKSAQRSRRSGGMLPQDIFKVVFGEQVVEIKF